MWVSPGRVSGLAHLWFKDEVGEELDELHGYLCASQCMME